MWQGENDFLPKLVKSTNNRTGVSLIQINGFVLSQNLKDINAAMLLAQLEKESEMGFNTGSEMWFKKELDTKNGKHYKKY